MKLGGRRLIFFFAEDDGLSLIFVKDQVTLLITQLEVT